MSLVYPRSLYLPKSFNFINAFACYKQKCKLAPFNLAHPVSGWDVRSRLSNRQLMSPPLCNTRRPGSSTSQTGKIRKKKFLCVWSAAVELTTTDCPWCITDTDSILCTTVFCFPEPTGHHHSASICVSFGCNVCLREHKFTYLLTYLLIKMEIKLDGETRTLLRRKRRNVLDSVGGSDVEVASGPRDDGAGWTSVSQSIDIVRTLYVQLRSCCNIITLLPTGWRKKLGQFDCSQL